MFGRALQVDDRGRDPGRDPGGQEQANQEEHAAHGQASPPIIGRLGPDRRQRGGQYHITEYPVLEPDRGGDHEVAVPLMHVAEGTLAPGVQAQAVRIVGGEASPCRIQYRHESQGGIPSRPGECRRNGTRLLQVQPDANTEGDHFGRSRDVLRLGGDGRPSRPGRVVDPNENADQQHNHRRGGGHLPTQGEPGAGPHLGPDRVGKSDWNGGDCRMVEFSSQEPRIHPQTQSLQQYKRPSHAVETVL